MPAYRSVRIQMPDRPGALSAVSTTLAVHGVDIATLEVAGHVGGDVVDDLLLSAPSQDDISAAVANFAPDVNVRFFEQPAGNATMELGLGVHAIAAAASSGAAWDGMLRHAARLGRADRAVAARAMDDGSIEFHAGGLASPPLAKDSAFAGRWSLSRGCAAAVPGDASWAPASLRDAAGAGWLAFAPLGPFDLLVLARKPAIPFLEDELERVALFAEAAGAVLSLRGELALSGSMTVSPVDELPPGSLHLATHFRAGSSAA